MEVVFGMLIAISGILLVLTCRSFTTLFHELGHAIPALMFTEQSNVNVLVGTYGDLSDCFHVSLGRLQLYIKINLLEWRLGLCMHEGVKGFWKNMMVLIGGPIASLVLASFFLYWMIQNAYSDGWVFVSAVFFVAALLDFGTNIYPHKSPIRLHDGTLTYSDGQQIYRLLQQSRYPEEYAEALMFLEKEDYNSAIETIERLQKDGFHKKAGYHILVEAYRSKKDYKKANEAFEALEKQHQLNSNDSFLKGQLLMQLGRYEEAYPIIQNTLHFDQFNNEARYFRAWIFLKKDILDEALIDLNAVIYADEQFDRAYSARGLVYLKKRDFETAFQNLEFALQLNPERADNHYHIGQYYEEKWNYHKALEHYQKAADLGTDFHGIQLCISEMEACLGKG